MEENKFRAFLEKGSFGDAINFSFVYDAVADQDLPDASTWEEVDSFIRENWKPDAIPKALDDAKYVWRLFQKEGQ